MPVDDLPAEVRRTVGVFLANLDGLAPGLVSGFYLVGSVALDDFHPSGAGRGRLRTASDIDLVAVTDRRLDPASRDTAALIEAHARTVARLPRPSLDGAMLTWADLADGPDAARMSPARRRIDSCRPDGPASTP